MDNKIFEKIISEINCGNFNTAIQYCGDILKEYPDNKSVYEIRSGCYYALGDYDAAISDLTYSIDNIMNGDDSKDELVNLCTKRGKIHLEKGEWLKASEDFKKILSINQNLSEIQNSLAVCYRRLDKYAEALFHSTQAIKLNHEYAEAYNNRANINISLEKYHEAIVDYSRSIELNPLNGNAYFNRGSIYYDVLNNKENAIQDFQKSISISPGFKDELNRHYPELLNVLEIKSDVNNEAPIPIIKEAEVPVIPEEKNSEVKNIDEDVVITKNDSEINFSLDEFDSLFGEKMKEPITEIAKDTEAKDDSKVPDFASMFDEKTESANLPAAKENKADDIVIPEFDLKSMFANMSEGEDLPVQEEDAAIEDRPIITEDVKSLHEEIQTKDEEKVTSGTMGGINFDNMSGFENKEPVFDKDPDSKYLIKAEEEKRSFLGSPIFFIIIIFLMAAIIIISVMKFFKTQENQIVNNTVVKVDSSAIKNSDSLKKEIKDTVTQKESETKNEVKKEEAKKEEVKKIETPPEEVKQKTELTAKNLGFISDKKQFVLFSEPDGYYVQIGSYKEKSKADEKLKFLEKNNIKGKVYEVDLNEKGIFYRVRAGVFASPEDAKAKTIKIE